VLRYIFEPGFFGSGPVHIALAVGTVIAITSAVVGVFTVTRGQSFAGHALGDLSTTGGSGAFLVGVNQFWGYLAFGAGAAAFMEMIGVQRRRGRDVATGVVLGAGLGLAALFLYLGTQYSSTTGASFTILFGSMFVITSSTVPALITSALLALATVVVLARVLLLTSLSPDIAAARGVPVRAVGAAFLMALAVSVALRGDHRRGAEHRAADRPGRDRAAGGQGPGPGDGRRGRHRRGGHLDRHRARLRQLLLAARPAGLAGQFLRGDPDRRLLPGQLPAPAAGTAGPGPRGTGYGAGMFSGLMLNTWIAATAVAVIAGVTGFFAVLRGSTFAAHAIPNGAFAGAAGASLLGLNAFVGLAVFSVAGALGIAGLSRRSRPDVATALTFVMILGVGALFVSWSTEYAQEAYSLLFGEVFGVSAGEVLPIVVLGAVSIVAIIVMFRPLMLASAMPEVAEARGVSPRRMELGFLLVMALATSMTVPVVGALLMFSLMIGPAAAARSLTARPMLAMALSVVIALITVWIGIAVSYQSNWPLGFFVGVIGAAFYLFSRAYAATRRRQATRTAPAAA
jgi:zinc/manganese transport system permease protein